MFYFIKTFSGMLLHRKVSRSFGFNEDSRWLHFWLSQDINSSLNVIIICLITAGCAINVPLPKYGKMDCTSVDGIETCYFSCQDGYALEKDVPTKFRCEKGNWNPKMSVVLCLGE